MYKQIINDLNQNADYHNIWPYDQYYISDYVFKNKDNFMIFVPDIMNTPIGKVLRHNWCKNEKMYNDLIELFSIKNEDLCTDKSFIETEYYDKQNFPNIIQYGYEYFN